MLVTSHKKQALDVIDNSLIEQFKTVHPRAKPPVLRLLSGDDRSVNEPANTLSAPVINAASHRYQADRTEAVERDRQHLLGVVQTANENFWEGADVYPALLKDAFMLSCLQQTLFPDGSPDSDVAALPQAAMDVKIEGTELIRLAGIFTKLQAPLSLQVLSDMAARRHELPIALEQCEQLSELRRGLDARLLAITQPVPDAVARLGALMDEMSFACRGDVPISTFTASPIEIAKESLLFLPDITTYAELCTVRDDLQIIAEEERKLLGKIFRNKAVAKRRKEMARFPAIAQRMADSSANEMFPEYMNAASVVAGATVQMPWLHPDYLVHAHKRLPPASLAQLAKTLHSLELSETITMVAAVRGGDFFEMTPVQIKEALAGLRRLREYQALVAKLSPISSISGIANSDLPAMYAFLKDVSALMPVLGAKDIAFLETLLTPAFPPSNTPVNALRPPFSMKPPLSVPAHRFRSSASFRAVSSKRALTRWSFLRVRVARPTRPAGKISLSKATTFSSSKLASSIRIPQKFRFDKFERKNFDFGDGQVCDHVPEQGDIEAVIRAAMAKIKLEGDRLSLKNKQEIELFFYSYLPVGTSKVVRENVEGAVVGITTQEMHRSSLRAGAVEQDASVFVSEDFETELGEQNSFVMGELLGKGKVKQGELGLKNTEPFDDKSIRQLMPLKHLHAVNTSLFRTPQELVILSHDPERQFMFRLIEHGKWLDGWVKAADTEFYSIDYEYWRRGKDRVRRSFNPDFFMQVNLASYLSKLKSDAAISGVARLHELQNTGIEDLIFVVEIKSDDDQSEETKAKEAYAKEHFISINRRLRETQEVDLPVNFRDSVRQHYLFNLLRPTDYPGWFSRLINGLAVVG